jgi:glycosyltransferase involved in cell wall biosynthesis
MASIILGIDASRNRSGGAIAHMVGLIEEANPERYGFREVHVWSYSKLLDALPDRTWLVRHNQVDLERNLLSQLYWQRYCFPGELQRAKCNIAFSTDSGSIGTFSPCVTLNQDLLSYEEGEMERLRWGWERFRLWTLLHVQNRSLRRSDGVIFLTQYAANVVQRTCGALRKVKIVPHGVHSGFADLGRTATRRQFGEREVRCVYVSSTAFYKHQWHVVRAIAILRAEGYGITLALVGGGSGPAQDRLDETLKELDPKGEFVTKHAFVSNEVLPQFIADSDIFVFASSCETFGITLLEGMAAGIPVACSDRSCLPEILDDGGIYFDPENPVSIANAIRKLIEEPQLRHDKVRRAVRISEMYSWNRCADETLSFISEIFLSWNNEGKVL